MGVDSSVSSAPDCLNRPVCPVNDPGSWGLRDVDEVARYPVRLPTRRMQSREVNRVCAAYRRECNTKGEGFCSYEGYDLRLHNIS